MDASNLVTYFDLASEARGREDRGDSGAGRLHWLPQYVALMVGIVVQPYLVRFLTDGAWNLHGLLGWTVASVLIAIMAFPAVYKNALDPDKPLVVQLCVIFSAGMGWQTLVGSALKLQQ